MQTSDWQEFEPATLEKARDQDRPILMVLTMPWCAYCKELLQTTFQDPDVVGRIHASFVPVLVDADRRPDVNERYGTGAWPTIAYLTPGGELICNDNYLTAEELTGRLDRVRSYYREHRGDIERGLEHLWSHKERRRLAERGKLNRQMVDDVVDAIYEKFDHRYGGWGESSKFPHPEAIDFALVQVVKRGDDRMREVVTLTLDRMMESQIHDIVDGGFFRFSRTRDWRSPNYEKLLDANAQRLRCYLEAYQVFGEEAYRRASEGVVGWMMHFMRDPETGTFFGSQDADADYYNLDRQGRAQRSPPDLDRTVYTNANAMTVSNLLKAAVVLDRPDLREAAMVALKFLLENLYDGQDVFHYWDGTYHLPGMLSDQAYLIRALIDASQHSGNADLLLPAEHIAEQAIARQKAPGGGFYDILYDPRSQGSMRRRNRSILENSVMAEALVRLSYLSRRKELYDEAIHALEAFANDYKEYGYYVAGYGRAVDLVFYEPLMITIVGERDTDAAEELRRAALAPYVPSRMVQMLDPRYDPVLIGRGGYQTDDLPVAYLTVARTTRAVVRTPEELHDAIEEIERSRRAQLD